MILESRVIKKIISVLVAVMFSAIAFAQNPVSEKQKPSVQAQNNSTSSPRPVNSKVHFIDKRTVQKLPSKNSKTIARHKKPAVQRTVVQNK